MESFITSAAILAVAAAGTVPLGNQVEVLLPESNFATTAKLLSFLPKNEDNKQRQAGDMFKDIMKLEKSLTAGKIESEVFGDEIIMTMT